MRVHGAGSRTGAGRMPGRVAIGAASGRQQDRGWPGPASHAYMSLKFTPTISLLPWKASVYTLVVPSSNVENAPDVLPV